MMWEDEIVQEVRKYREAYAAKFNFDLQAMYEDLKKAERKSKHKKGFVQTQETYPSGAKIKVFDKMMRRQRSDLHPNDVVASRRFCSLAAKQSPHRAGDCFERKNTALAMTMQCHSVCTRGSR